ncbi:SGNH/GDSL hydrolase family protein [Spirosoma sp. KUDC1026]|uniref:SGNH/GDSL hydrolase family protein n=1 Tax=Spirosoma sp. KUDC1026 TaxID=2745947 RepID=UPI00159BAB99|nr:SGNH/GDSL hydrolase family protein [Spirosoma sp. KUDC1026]QKZ11275.1 SGNH/GDSL hydrolase family protein [Spirosoma sp. KUDC1026]
MKVLLLFLPILVACTQLSTTPTMVLNPNGAKSTYRFLSLGDSYTIGESVDASARWSVQLAGMLRKDGLDVGDPDIIARTGWTTAELQAAIGTSGNTNQYDLVSLMIGVNNQYRGQSQERYRTEFEALLKTAITFAKGNASHVFVLSIPDWGKSPYANGRNPETIAAEIDTFNAIAQAECQKAGVSYVDITPISRQATGDATQFANDGLHYSGKQMKLWAEKALPVAKALLKP